jgi:large subunit ribosomal protein L25
MATASRTELTVTPREVVGKKVKALRREGVIPANIYGRGIDSTAVQVRIDELQSVLKTAGRNEIVYLTLDGEEARPTFIKQVQHHPWADHILHVDFLQISLKEKVKIDVPIHLVGLAPAVDRYSGILVHGLDHITVEALPTDVPSSVEADVSGLEEIDAAFHVSQLEIPEGVTLLTDPEQVVAKVSPPAVEIVVEEEEGEEVAEGEEGAEPAAEAGEAEAPAEAGEEESSE